ncbi:uncharacterized protein Z518_08065 [Rhinocladiella mackenziei CBS 650.93]|uniref:Rhinocladiella mackenziei CBS 650.93 unplaced genomic scaffold supercont1.6, whole genome shotgun sequence n=1 Tax=Rhinocladiella mackenziei CBS 650.93 TaxID=1442369 RepID=A0A0D2IFT1_9EURO|nr:uncharacterized protein Z518_08065 [Rhinocladiella mackenziei CBS 650.93]KIX02126.1 hypothetical protein Z518_08065 [Rhinocladiella mackenziei CBS 650.93]
MATGRHSERIADVAASCSAVFSEYLASSTPMSKDGVEELQSRFNLWAAYTGAFAPAGTSLDDRLRFHEDVKRMVLKLLHMLHRNVQSALQADRRNLSNMASGLWASGFGNSNEGTFHGLVAASAALDRLHRLSIAIRRSSAENRKDKLLQSEDSERDLFFRQCILLFVQERFPSARSSLQEHLADALCFQRKRLIYQPRHNKKLAHQEIQQLDTGRTNAQLTERTLHDFQLRNTDRILHPPAAATAPMGAMSTTDASVPNAQVRRMLMKPNRFAPTVVSTGSILQKEPLSYPDPPRHHPGQKLLPCPYCAEPLLTANLDFKRRANVVFWEAHVSQDLEPYFCISEACEKPLQSFARFQDWYDHMNSVHTPKWHQIIHMLSWYCDLGHDERILFATRQAYEAHMREVHGDLTRAQFLARTKRSKFTAQREILTCPFCDAVPDKLQFIDAMKRADEALEVLAKHVAIHIKALSLLTFRLLPSSDDDVVGDNVESEVSHILQSISREPSIPYQDNIEGSVDFGDDPQDLHLANFQNNEMEVGSPPRDTPEPEYWTFLPSFEHLNRDNPDIGHQHHKSKPSPLSLLRTPSVPSDSANSNASSIDLERPVETPVDSNAPRTYWLLPPIKPHLKGRKTLVLDLDETLIHSSFKIVHQADFAIPVEVKGQYHNVYVIKRPGVDAFMARVGQLFEIVLFTESKSHYADPVLDQLDIHHVIHHRLFRESCYNHQGNYVKDLSMLGRDLQSTIIVDNSPASYIFHPQHALPISSWFSDAHDTELLDLIPVLEDLAASNVRDISLVLDIAL